MKYAFTSCRLELVNSPNALIKVVFGDVKPEPLKYAPLPELSTLPSAFDTTYEN